MSRVPIAFICFIFSIAAFGEQKLDDVGTKTKGCDSKARAEAVKAAQASYGANCWWQGYDENGPNNPTAFDFHLICSKTAKDAKTAEEATDKIFEEAHIPVGLGCKLGAVTFSTYD